MNRIVGLILLVFCAHFVNGQNNKVELQSPYHSILNHLQYLQKENYQPKLAAQSLNISNVSAVKKERLAIQLKQILDGKGIYVLLKDLPQDENYLDSATGKSVYTISSIVPQIYVEKVGSKWLYSKESIDAIPMLHKEVYPFGADKLVNMVPHSWQMEFLGLQVWQYFGFVLIILIAWIVYKLFLLLVKLIIIRVLHYYNDRFNHSIHVDKVARPFSWFLIFHLIAQLVPLLLLPIGLAKYIVMILNIIVPLFGTLVFYHLVALLSDFFKKLAAKTEGTLDDQLVPLVSKILKVLVIIIGVIYILISLGVDVKPYIAGISIGGLAFALAAQDTIKNLFGSLMIFVDKPFQIGDWINYNGMDGTVEEVGFRSTRMRTFYNSIISVPNGKLADSTVDNFGLRVYRRYSTKLAITYDTPPELIETFVEGLREIVLSHPSTRKDYFEIHLNELGDSSIQILFYIFFEVPSWTDELKGRHEVILKVLKLANELNVRFAFPTQTIHIENFREKASDTPVYKKSRNDYKTDLEAFIKELKSAKLHK